MSKSPRKKKAATDKLDYRNGTFPALCAYLDRIGAQQRNFRRFVVVREGRHAYHYDAAVIKIDGTTVACSDPEFAPTEEEAKAIALELAKAEWPTSVPVRDTVSLRKLIKDQRPGREPELFEFKNEVGEIVFVQERIRKADGSKADLPWSYWDDGAWRCMEPSGDLPLFGLDRLISSLTVFLHEGAKSAAHVQRMVDSGDATHPWSDELRYSVHLGWPGGAPNPHRVDWGPIKRLPPDARVVIVCDNDMGGEEAAPLISRLLQRRLRVIRFGEAFPPHFDLADPFPPGMWEEKKDTLVYHGPKFIDCLGPATWVTRGKPPKCSLRDEFIGEWYFSIKPQEFMLREHTARRWAPEEFNALLAPYSDTANVAGLIRKHPSAQAETLVYEPGEASGRIAFEGRQVINVFQPSPIQPPRTAPKREMLKPWLDFMEHLIPDKDDREALMKWCATLIARPDVHMTFSVLLISETQGVGKGTLMEKIIAPLVGFSNCSFPSASEVTEDKFTSWRAFKRLALVAELYDGQTSKAYNRLKTLITDERVRVEEKYQAPYDVRNHLHIIASSNSLRALKLDDGDRRWLVPGVREKKRDPIYWRTFNDWLKNGGLEMIAWWAQDYVEAHGHVFPGEEAPSSAAKRRSVHAAMSDGEKIVVELGERLAEHEMPAVIRLDVIRSWLQYQKSQGQEYGSDGARFLEKPETIAARLRGCGLSICGKRFKKDGVKFQVVSNFDIDEESTKWGDLEPKLLRPEQLCPDPAPIM